MGLSREQEALRDRFFQSLLDVVIQYQTKADADREVTLEALIEANEQLHEHLERELAELRVEQAE